MIDKLELNTKASILRKALNEDDFSPIDIFTLVQTIENLTLIFYPLENISGICYKGADSDVIVINSNQSVGRQRFSLAHELYHLYYDESEQHMVSMATIGEGDENERKADQFASYLLIPPASLHSQIEKLKIKRNRNQLAIDDVIALAQYYGVSHGAMLYRLRTEGLINHSQLDDMKTGVRDIAATLGYDTAIYYPVPKDKQTRVLGHYIKSSEILLKEDCISQGKYEELLLDAFRADIVYGVEEAVPVD